MFQQICLFEAGELIKEELKSIPNNNQTEKTLKKKRRLKSMTALLLGNSLNIHTIDRLSDLNHQTIILKVKECFLSNKYSQYISVGCPEKVLVVGNLRQSFLDQALLAQG